VAFWLIYAGEMEGGVASLKYAFRLISVAGDCTRIGITYMTIFKTGTRNKISTIRRVEVINIHITVCSIVFVPCYSTWGGIL
jgi:hypothetical protein